MAISLGSLYIELKANTAQFLDSMTKASTNVRAFGRDLETGFSKMGALFAPLGEGGERLAQVFDMVGRSSRSALAEIGKSGALVGGLAGLTGGASALGGALFALAEKSSEVGSRIFEASEKTGIAASQMSGLMALTKETGGDFDALTVSLARAGTNLQKAIIEPAGDAGKILSQVLGGSTKLAAESAKTMGDRIQDVLKHIFELNNVGERNVALSTLLGKGWMNNVEVLKLLAEQGFAPAIARAHELGIFFDSDGAQAAKNFQVALKEVQGELSGVGLAFGQKVLPYMQTFLQHVITTIPYLEALGLRTLAVYAAMTGVGLPLAVKMWEEANQKLKQVDQTETNFLDRIQRLTAGEKSQREETNRLTGTTKARADALVALVGHERDELNMLNANGDKMAELGVEYRKRIADIQSLVAAGNSYTASLQAQALALEIFRKKLMALPPVIPGAPALLTPNPPPELALPEMPRGLLGSTPGPPAQTLSQLAQLKHSMDGTVATQRALRLETDLSSASFAKLLAAFPKLASANGYLAEQEIAATAAGQKLIEKLSKMDQLGTFGQQFKEMTDSLINAGDNLGGNFLRTFGTAIDGIEDKLAELAVKGKTNFRELGQALEASLVKSVLQKGVSITLSHSIFSGAGTKADGSKASPFYVRLADDLKRLAGAPGAQLGQNEQGSGALSQIGKVLGQGEDGQQGGVIGTLDHVLSGIGSDFAKALGGLGKGLGSFVGFFGKIFGGFLASGGDMLPGKGYVVGEDGPEFIVPKAWTTAVPAVGAHQGRPLVINQTWNIATPDVDNFRRSQGQLISEAYRHAVREHSRNS